MNKDLDKLKSDHKNIHDQIEECQKKLQNLELLIGFEFSNESSNLYQAKNESNY